MVEKKVKDSKKEGSEMEDRQALQEKYMKAQMLEQQYKQLQKYLESFDEQIAAIRALVEAIHEFSHLKKGDKIMAPLTNGIFIKATLEDSSELMINVGQNTVVAKKIPDAINMLESQEKEVVKYKSETMKQLEELMSQIDELQM